MQGSTLSGLSVFTIAQAYNGRRISLTSAEKLIKTIGIKTNDMFFIGNYIETLSDIF